MGGDQELRSTPRIVLVVISRARLRASFPGLLLIPFIAFFGGLMFASMAMLFTALVPNIDSFNYPFFLFITPMFLFSGTFFPLSVLPEWGQQLAMTLPLTHITNMTRDLSYEHADRRSGDRHRLHHRPHGHLLPRFGLPDEEAPGQVSTRTLPSLTSTLTRVRTF